MFDLLLKLVPVLWWDAVSAMNLGGEQISIDTCISAVQIYYPCGSITPTNHTCLCEQYTWHVACYDNHAINPSSHPLRTTAESTMYAQCRSAGSISAGIVQRKYHHQRRQIDDILSSVGNVAASILSAQSVTIGIPPPVPSIPSIPSIPVAPPAGTTAEASTTASNPPSRAPKPKPSTLSTSPSATASNVSQLSTTSTSTAASSSSSKSSSPSPGLIAGAVIGGVAVLLLLAILIMLILRHKRRKRQHATLSPEAPAPVYKSAGSLDETLVDRTPMTECRTLTGGGLGGGNEKEVHRTTEPEIVMPVESEMETRANVWELDGRERVPVVPSELESPVVRKDGGRAFDDWPLPRQERGVGTEGTRARPVQRGEHLELHF